MNHKATPVCDILSKQRGLPYQCSGDDDKPTALSFKGHAYSDSRTVLSFKALGMSMETQCFQSRTVEQQ